MEDVLCYAQAGSIPTGCEASEVASSATMLCQHSILSLGTAEPEHRISAFFFFFFFFYDYSI